MTKTPAKRQTLSELRELQRLTARAIMRPLAPGNHMQRQWTDDRDAQAVVSEFIKPNDRLTSFERIEIYNKQYWFRLIDCLYDDYPGLRGVLGERKFNKLVRGYLQSCPSRSFSLRNLGSRLIQFIEQHPELVLPRLDLAIDMARFEWAQVEAFDGKAEPIVTVDDLLGEDPATLRLALQPYISVLRLGYPLDDYVLQLKQDSLRGQASNATEESRADEKRKLKAVLPSRETVHVVVHRHHNSMYYKRVDAEAYAVLSALASGRTLAAALSQPFEKAPDADRIREWFETWTSLGWFCKPARSHR